mgnify:CR=1 FL=1
MTPPALVFAAGRRIDLCTQWYTLEKAKRRCGGNIGYDLPGRERAARILIDREEQKTMTTKQKILLSVCVTTAVLAAALIVRLCRECLVAAPEYTEGPHPFGRLFTEGRRRPHPFF